MRTSAAAFFVIVLAGCRGNLNGSLSSSFPAPVRIALEQATEFELVSLDPAWSGESSPKEFDRHRVLGKTTIKDAVTRKRLLSALDSSVRANKPSHKCFDPRHAIRVEGSGRIFYIVICFHCNNIYIRSDDDLEHQDYVPTDISPLSVFDEVLKTANVPLAKDGQLEDKLGEKPKHDEKP